MKRRSPGIGSGGVFNNQDTPDMKPITAFSGEIRGIAVSLPAFSVSTAGSIG